MTSGDTEVNYSKPETNASSPSGSQNSAQSTARNCQLWPRAPITYNETALSRPLGWPQTKIFPIIPILIEDKEEDTNFCEINCLSKSDLSESP